MTEQVFYLTKDWRPATRDTAAMVKVIRSDGSVAFGFVDQEQPLEKANPYHEPAGSPEGGRFAHAPGGAGIPGTGLSAYPRDAEGVTELNPWSNGPDKGKAFNRALENELANYRALGSIMPEVELTRDEHDAVKAYVGDAFYEMNQGLYGRHALTEREWKYVQNLDVVFKKSEAAGGLPQDVTVMRGIRRVGEKFPKGAESIGVRFADKGFLSTTMATGKAFGFAGHRDGGAVVVMEVPKGTPAIHVGKQVQLMGTLGMPPVQSGEAELILPRGTEFEITKYVPRGIKSVGFGGSATDTRYQDVIYARLVKKKK